MMTDEKIARINELYHKMKESGLTAKEKEEQTRLRREYIDAMKASLQSNLDRVRVVNKDGTIEELKKKHV
jgi:uncharacterized protein YnzC (UPF0291/DUF896 family)